MSPNYSTPFDNKSVSCHFFSERKISIHHFSASLRSAKSCKKLQKVAKSCKELLAVKKQCDQMRPLLQIGQFLKDIGFASKENSEKSPAFLRLFQSQIGKCLANQHFLKSKCGPFLVSSVFSLLPALLLLALQLHF